MTKDAWLTTAELAQELNMPEGTLKSWRHYGNGPSSVKLGPQNVRYRRSVVDRWIAEQERREQDRRQVA